MKSKYHIMSFYPNIYLLVSPIVDTVKKDVDTVKQDCWPPHVR